MPTAYVLYHFLYPNVVISAKIFSMFAEELSKRKWKIIAITSNRYFKDSEKNVLRKNEIWKGTTFIRVYRPKFSQANSYLRLLNSAWMIIAWTLRLIRLPRADVIIVGTDPQFSAIIFPLIKYLRKADIIVHWVFDIFPEAIIADDASKVYKNILCYLSKCMKYAYRFVDVMVDIGPSMRKVLKRYRHNAKCETFVPWAIVELNGIKVSDESVRRELFGNARLALLYSGNLGRAHDYEKFLNLARLIKTIDNSIVFNFGCMGYRQRELHLSIRPNDHNIRISSFVDEANLEKRINSADIMLVSLRKGWEGIVVPSKFFGSLAIGKPVLYSGSEDSDIGQWIKKYKVGWILNEDNTEEIAEILMNISRDKNILRELQENSINVYKFHFSKKSTMDKWARSLGEMVEKKKIERSF